MEGAYPVSETYFNDLGVEDHSITIDMDNTDQPHGTPHPYL